MGSETAAPAAGRAQVCCVCRHDNREEIDRALLRGVGVREVEARFGVPKSSAHRHKQRHILEAVSKAHAAHEVAAADGLLVEVMRLSRKAAKILRLAEKKTDYRAAIGGVREGLRAVELKARLLGELREQANVNVLVASPGWQALQAAIVEALEPHPEAKAAVISALDRLLAPASTVVDPAAAETP